MALQRRGTCARRPNRRAPQASGAFSPRERTNLDYSFFTHGTRG
ncbi:hypothetical protein C7S16_3821 [Burkholderia thailandensis]|uniref:Uncharacterized protein n=1 Tax=Burkholderia thailandensis TaxID=57975 RepID=A0AAW9CVH5_BURTH|nr:hypothetical protein [Burkholderia thailandensis]